MRGGELVVGLFQGLPACVRIAVGRGVCGTAVRERATQVVPDVHAFPGHIACDPRSRSEIVVPIEVAGAVVAVLDLDSDRLAHFDDDDRRGLEALVRAIAPAIDWVRAGSSGRRPRGESAHGSRQRLLLPWVCPTMKRRSSQPITTIASSPNRILMRTAPTTNAT
jgi:hypothetical protein